MRLAPVFAAALLLIALGPAAPPGEARDGSRADRDALLAVDARFSDEVGARGFQAFEQFFAEDAVYLPTFQPRVEGREAILDTFRPLYGNTKIRLTWTPLRADVAASGDLGWTTGSYELTRVDDAGAAHVTRGKYVTIWRRQKDGSWRAVLDGGSPDAPPPAPRAAAAAPDQGRP